MKKCERDGKPCAYLTEDGGCAVHCYPSRRKHWSCGQYKNEEQVTIEKIKRVKELNGEIAKIEKMQISPLVNERTELLNSMTLEELKKCSDES